MAKHHPHLNDEQFDAAVRNAARCKAMRSHRFDPIGPVGGAPRPQFGVLVTLRCETCGTIRFDVVSRVTGERLSSPTYDHPDWYLAAGTERHDTAWWRAQWYSTLDDNLLEATDELTPRRRRKRA
jgi:hypothetical protein